MKKRIPLIIIAALAITFIAWTIWGNITVGVTHYTIQNERIPEAFQGYKIVVVSDFHNAKFGDNNDVLVEKISKENPDIIAITGDLVDSSRTDIDIAISFVSRLSKIAPCYYVTGNHEVWIGEKNLEELEERLLAENVKVLHNESVILENEGEVIVFAGIDDPDFKDRDTAVQEYIEKIQIQEIKMERGEKVPTYTILLSHRPETFNAYVTEDIDLVLAGHAHGGQFRLPFIGGMIAPNQGFFPKYDAGVYVKNKTTMIVSRGIGNSVIPVRIGNRPEIVVIELECNL